MKRRGSEEITLREGLPSKSTDNHSGFEKDLRGGERGQRGGTELQLLCGEGVCGVGVGGSGVGAA